MFALLTNLIFDCRYNLDYGLLIFYFLIQICLDHLLAVRHHHLKWWRDPLVTYRVHLGRLGHQLMTILQPIVMTVVLSLMEQQPHLRNL